jgi:hypothetical protein
MDAASAGPKARRRAITLRNGSMESLFGTTISASSATGYRQGGSLSSRDFFSGGRDKSGF